MILRPLRRCRLRERGSLLRLSLALRLDNLAGLRIDFDVLRPWYADRFAFVNASLVQLEHLRKLIASPARIRFGLFVKAICL